MIYSGLQFILKLIPRRISAQKRIKQILIQGRPKTHFAGAPAQR